MTAKGKQIYNHLKKLQVVVADMINISGISRRTIERILKLLKEKMIEIDILFAIFILFLLLF
jgi:hypothetical protein